jgi:chaperonin GroEL
MAHLVAITLGPLQGHIVHTRVNTTQAELLHDAATIVRRVIQLPGRIENTGAMIMRQLVWYMRRELGDGSATAAVLAGAIAREMHRLVMAGAHPMILKRGIDRGVQAAVNALDELSMPLEGRERIAGLATAAIGDAEIGGMLGEMYAELGPHACVAIQPIAGTKHEIAYREGTRFEGECISRYLLTDRPRRVAALSDVHVLVAEAHFQSPESVANALYQVHQAGGKNLFIICKSISSEGLTIMVGNNDRDTVRSSAARIKPQEDLLRGRLQDVALLTGATFITEQSGMDLADITADDLGYAKRIVATDRYVTIIGGHGDPLAIDERVAILRRRLERAIDPEDKDNLRESLGRLIGGVGEFRPCALTEQDRKEVARIAAQAIRTVQVGMESGVVPGGGAAYLAVIPQAEAVEAEGDEAMGVQIVARALEEPMRCIASNAGVHAPLVIAESRRRGPGYGFDVYSKEVVDMEATGIVDSTEVVKRALQQAASGAAMLLTTEALVLHRDPEMSYLP